MPSNIEIKARVTDWERLRAAAEQISDSPTRLFSQEDVFFQTRSGRLKLRIFSPDAGELIHYDRPDTPGPKQSRYAITPTTDPAGLQAILAAVLGVRAVIRKQRYLYMAGQTRIHLDEVEGLGRFVELEVVLRADQTAEQGQQIATDLMARLGIAPADLVAGAYVDML